MPAPLRVALIGYGLAGSAFHAPFIAAIPDFRLAAIVTRSPERRAQALRDHPGVSLFESADELWSRPDEFDVAVIAAPNKAHVPLGLAALDAGLPVVVDKPLATSAAEGRTLVDAAHERGLMLTVFQNRRWDGDFLTVRRLLSEDALGRVLRFEARFERWRPDVGSGWREKADDEQVGCSSTSAAISSTRRFSSLGLCGPSTPSSRLAVPVHRWTTTISSRSNMPAACAHTSG